jgi:hypothetical protein
MRSSSSPRRPGARVCAATRARVCASAAEDGFDVGFVSAERRADPVAVVRLEHSCGAVTEQVRDRGEAHAGVVEQRCRGMTAELVRRHRLAPGVLAQGLGRAPQVRRVDRGADLGGEDQARSAPCGADTSRSSFWRVECARSAARTGEGRSRVLDCFVFVSPSRGWPRSFFKEPATVSVPTLRSRSSHRRPVSSPGRRPNMSAVTKSASRRWPSAASSTSLASSG